MNDDDREDSKTAFNSSLDIIQRISRLEYSLASAMLGEDLPYAFKLLLLIGSEIDFKLSEEEREELDEFGENLKEGLRIAEIKYTHDGKIYIKFPKIRKKVYRNILD